MSCLCYFYESLTGHLRTSSIGWILIFTLLEGDADWFVLVEVLLLTLDVAIHYDAAIVTVDLTWFEADRADCKIWSDIFASSHLIWHKVLIISGVRVRSEIHQEPSHVLSTSHGSEV